MKDSMERGSHQQLATCIESSLTNTLLYLVFHNSQKLFSLGTDDGHRIVLTSFSDGVKCEHDYINATYIDVRSLKINCKCLSQNT